MASDDTRGTHEQWLLELTSIPTAAGAEDRVIAWVERWVARRRNLKLRRDRAGNLFITIQKGAGSKRVRAAARRPQSAPLFITAHLDHPAFVVTAIHGRDIELEFRGGVHDPYFKGARIEIFDQHGGVHLARVQALNPKAVPFKRVTARLDANADVISIGDVGRWVFPQHHTMARITNGLLYTHACDDLAAVAAALAALDTLRTRRGMEHCGVMLTRAEEVGFIGAIAACQARSVPKNARLICLENSRSFAESPIGAGPIVRVGDKMSVFEPTLTNAISMLMMQHEHQHRAFRWQRKLMPGGTCEATTFSTYGYQSTCLCLPLGNYHNMVDIDGVLAGKSPAKVGPEFISVSDFHGLVEMLVVCATRLDSADRPTLRSRMEGLIATYGHVLEKTASRRA